MGAGEVQPSLHHTLGGLQRGVGPAPHPAPGPAHQAPRSNQNNHRFRISSAMNLNFDTFFPTISLQG